MDEGERRRDQALALAALVVLASASVIPPETALPWRLPPVILAIVLALIGWRRPSPAGGVAVLVAVLLLTMLFVSPLWQLAMVVAVGGLALASWRREGFGGVAIERGKLPLGGTLICALVTPIALVGWVYLLDPNVDNIIATIPDLPTWQLILGGVVFALVNASFEEWIWRGVFQTRLTELFGATAAIVLQAASFGLTHAWGFPRGVVGVVLAGTWAAMLGILRHRAEGLLAVVIAHVVADATIAAIVIFWLR